MSTSSQNLQRRFVKEWFDQQNNELMFFLYQMPYAQVLFHRGLPFFLGQYVCALDCARNCWLHWCVDSVLTIASFMIQPYCFFFEPGKQLGKPPLLYFIKTQKTNTEQDKRKTLLVIHSEARTRRKTKNHLTQESTQERKTYRLFSKILYACSRASSSRDLLVSQADSYMTQAYMDMRKFTR